MNRWQEYKDGKLTPPVCVQWDEVTEGYLALVWDGTEFVGPIACKEYDEKVVLAMADVIIGLKTAQEIPVADVKDTEIAELKAEIVKLSAELVTAKAVGGK